EEQQIDDKTFGKLIEEEIERINNKNGRMTEPRNRQLIMDNEKRALKENHSVGIVHKEEKPVKHTSSSRRRIDGTREINWNEVAGRRNIEKKKVSLSNVQTDSLVFDMERLIQYLNKNNVKYIDNRGKNGCLWIESDEAHNDMMKAIRIDGKKLGYSQKSKALKGQPGWYIS
ncbi:MAG: hypothetical protein J6A79_19090, partial [Clostridia bacterium]|nr:hypothetical protein [Clostridia bacterium]